MKKELRHYQQTACKALHAGMQDNKRPYAALITGLGKSLVLAALANRYVNENRRVLMLVPRKELVEQNHKEAWGYFNNASALGIVCSQLNKKQKNRQCVIAMPSSFVNLRTKSGNFDYLLIDECHRLAYRPATEKPGTIQKIITSLLRLNPHMKVCGVTGTPYRLDQGELHETSLKTLPFFTDKVFDSSIDPGLKSLIADGYLSHIETLNSRIKVDLTGVKLSGYDFNMDAAGVKFDAIIDDAVVDIHEQFMANNIQTALIFVSTIANAKRVLAQWGDNSTMRIVCGDTAVCSKEHRTSAIEWLKNGTGFRAIVNVDILTEGYDHQSLQCVVLLRATTSPGLLVQMVGRVIRPHDDKEVGYLIDYGTNLDRLTVGGIEDIIVPKPKKRRAEAPKKPCTAIIETPVMYEELHYRVGDVCGYPNLLSAKKCRVCEAEFIPMGEEGKYAMRTKGEALALKQAKIIVTYDVKDVFFDLVNSKKDDIPMVKMAFYDLDGGHIANSYLCFDHSGQAKNIATARLMELLKDKKSYYQIRKFEGGVSSKSVHFLTGEEYYDQFFKRIKSVTVETSGRFPQVLDWGF